jgi:hypothetical protein
VRTSQCVEILLAQEKRAENAGVFAQSQAQAVNEGEVSAGELQAHGSIKCTFAMWRCGGTGGVLCTNAGSSGGR